jgi:hypothetical protein
VDCFSKLCLHVCHLFQSTYNLCSEAVTCQPLAHQSSEYQWTSFHWTMSSMFQYTGVWGHYVHSLMHCTCLHIGYASCMCYEVFSSIFILRFKKLKTCRQNYVMPFSTPLPLFSRIYKLAERSVQEEMRFLSYTSSWRMDSDGNSGYINWMEHWKKCVGIWEEYSVLTTKTKCL